MAEDVVDTARSGYEAASGGIAKRVEVYESKREALKAVGLNEMD